jgi:hypothetical protein
MYLKKLAESWKNLSSQSRTDEDSKSFWHKKLCHLPCREVAIPSPESKKIRILRPRR